MHVCIYVCMYLRRKVAEHCEQIQGWSHACMYVYMYVCMYWRREVAEHREQIEGWSHAVAYSYPQYTHTHI